MSKPQNFSWALNAALLTCGVLYLGVMLCNLAAGKKLGLPAKDIPRIVSIETEL